MFNPLRNTPGQFLLQRKDVTQVAVVTLCPEMRIGGRTNGCARTRTRLARVIPTFNNSIYSQLSRDSGNGFCAFCIA